MEAAKVEIPSYVQADMLRCCVCNGIVCDPVQLSCLHNCCRACINPAVTTVGAIAVDVTAVGVTAVGPSPMIECPQCKETTTVGFATRNDFVASRVRAFNVSTGAAHCDLCAEDGTYDAPADAWCHDCQRAFCNGCIAGHNRYNKGHDVTLLTSPESALSSRAVIPTCLCKVHGQRASFVCLTCKALACATCLLGCTEANHDLKHAVSQRLGQLVCDVSTSVTESQRLLSGVSNFVASQDSFITSLEEGRRSGLDLLKLNKKKILECVSRVYASAEEALNDCYDQLTAKALDVARAAGSLASKSDWAIKYTQCLLDSADASSLYSQQQVLLQRLQALLVDFNELVCNVDRASRVIIDGGVTSKMEEVIKSSVGIPRCLTDWLNDRATASGQAAVAAAQFTVGDRVTLACTDEQLVELQKDLSPCLSEIRKCRGKTGTVQQVRGGRAVLVFYEHANTKFLLHPKALNKAFKVGDFVTVAFSSNQVGKREPELRRAQGRRGKVTQVLPNGKVNILIIDEYFHDLDQAWCTLSKN